MTDVQWRFNRQATRPETMYASGRHAIAICDRCGWKKPWLSLAAEPGTGWRVCQECNDKNYSKVAHPQNYPATNLTDAVALRWARPDQHAVISQPYYLADENGNVLEWYQEIILETATSAGQMNYQSAPFGYG